MAYVPHPIVKEILKKQDNMDIRANWIAKIEEYDLEIQLTKLIREKGLAQLLAEGNEEAFDLKEDPFPMVSVVSE